jgi:aerobic carbon-monoxide dehydrogenase medium subunit
MKPPRFEYFRPDTLDETIGLLSQYAGEAKVLAGGQSLIPLLNMRLARPAALVDINRVVGLQALDPVDGGLRIGATVRQRALQREPLIIARLPVLAEAATYIGHQQIRSRGTICGSLAHADPAAELPALALALQAELVATGPRGARTIPADQFYQGYLTTALEPSEVLTEVRFQAPPASMAWAFMEVSRRHGDFALVGIVAGLSVDRERDAVSDARLAYFGVGPTPIRASQAERQLLGQSPGAEAFAAAGEAASQATDPADDVHATAEYRRSVTAALTRRALRQAWQRLN